MNNEFLNASRFEIQFRMLDNADSVIAFPCDACGHVELDALNDARRNAYLYARVVVGRTLSPPAIVAMHA